MCHTGCVDLVTRKSGTSNNLCDVRILHGSHGGDVDAASFWTKKFHRSISADRSLYRRNFSHAWHCRIITSTVSDLTSKGTVDACSDTAACALSGNATNEQYTAACSDVVEFNIVVDIFKTSPHALRSTSVRNRWIAPSSFGSGGGRKIGSSLNVSVRYDGTDKNSSTIPSSGLLPDELDPDMVRDGTDLVVVDDDDIVWYVPGGGAETGAAAA